MKLELDIPDEQADCLERGAALTGQTLPQLVRDVVMREARRQFYVLRSQPKNKSSARKTPVGRPRIQPEELQQRELEKYLRSVYVKLELRLGFRDFDALHGQDLGRLNNLIETHDLSGLQAFMNEQPWQKRK